MRFAILFLAVSWGSGAAFADPATAHRFGPNEGEVLQVYPEAREIMIRHGHLPELDMDPMSMVFKVADPGVLDRVRKGDRVRFKPGLLHGRFAILSIERLPRSAGENTGSMKQSRRSVGTTGDGR